MFVLWSVLWCSRLVSELRFSHWENGIPLPRMGPSTSKQGRPQCNNVHCGQNAWRAAAGGDASDGSGACGIFNAQVDLDAILLHQKLQVLNICIHR